MSRCPKVLFLVPLLAALLSPGAAGADALYERELPQEIPDPPAAGFTRPAVALRPDGGFVAVYRDTSTGAVLGRWFGPLALGGVSESGHFEIETAESFARNDNPVAARGADGAFLAVWRHEGPGPAALRARAFDGEGRPLSETQAVAPGLVSGFALTARPGGGFALAWVEESDGGGDLLVRVLGPRGSPAGTSAVVVAPGVGPATVGAAANPDGTLAVTWSSYLSPEETTGLQGRTFSAGGEPLGGAFEIVVPGPTFRSVQHDVAATDPGSFLVAWAGRARPALWVRAFDSAGELGPVHRLDTVGEVDFPAGSPAVAAGPGGGVVAWTEGAGGPLTQARLVEADGTPRSAVRDFHTPEEVEADGINDIEVDRDDSGRVVFGWGTTMDSPILPPESFYYWTSLARRFLEGESGEPPPPPPPPPPVEPPPPPDAPALVSNEVPGFRTWVVITGPSGEPVLGVQEDRCIPETLCVSGRLPGRSEVFVRIVGPKPNGRLWPTLVKFSTSTVEVWIEQVATGEVEYYRLEGARPGFDELPGLFDREGFPP